MKKYNINKRLLIINKKIKNLEILRSKLLKIKKTNFKKSKLFQINLKFKFPSKAIYNKQIILKFPKKYTEKNVLFKIKKVLNKEIKEIENKKEYNRGKNKHFLKLQSILFKKIKYF